MRGKQAEMGKSSSVDSGPAQPPASSLQAETSVADSVHIQVEEQDTDCENSPLINVKQGRGTKPRAGRWWNRYPARNWNWKNLSATACLWLTYLFVSAAYSIIGPFFPSEVENFSSTTMSGYSGLTLSPAPSPQMLHV